MRKLILSGRIVADAEKKVTVNGREFISFRLGNNEFGLMYHHSIRLMLIF